MKRRLVLPIVLGWSLVATVAYALPRYAAVYGQDCQLCHQDPTGGGLRSLYASQFLVPNELAARTPDLESIEPSIGKRLHFGIDLRTLFVEREDGDGRQLQMQSDLYLAHQVDERTSIRLDIGQNGVQQAFGMVYVLPSPGWLKIGRFTPNYGWRFADHQLFVRRYVLDTVGVRSPRDWLSTGVEVGVSPGGATLTASVDEGGSLGESWTASALWRANAGDASIAVGGSVLRRQQLGGHRRSAGVHGQLRYGPVVWLSQWDEPREGERRERILTQELSVRVVQGWSLRATWSFHDPSRDLESGARRRYSAGLDVLGSPFLGVLLMANYDDPEPGPDVTEDGGWSADLVLHFLY